ncbi:MAG: hypothetical protein BWY50_01929 [Spirochaetes bacterium ADurb.Bin315]|nr:MAG: hypothetical protein BWY50_01929 [Spirochaetes bacterium ADurb.Bin315]
MEGGARHEEQEGPQHRRCSDRVGVGELSSLEDYRDDLEPERIDDDRAWKKQRSQFGEGFPALPFQGGMIVLGERHRQGGKTHSSDRVEEDSIGGLVEDQGVGECGYAPLAQGGSQIVADHLGDDLHPHPDRDEPPCLEGGCEGRAFRVEHESESIPFPSKRYVRIESLKSSSCDRSVCHAHRSEGRRGQQHA